MNINDPEVKRKLLNATSCKNATVIGRNALSHVKVGHYFNELKFNSQPVYVAPPRRQFLKLTRSDLILCGVSIPYHAIAALVGIAALNLVTGLGLMAIGHG